MIANRVFRHFIDFSQPGALWQSWKKAPGCRAHFDFSHRSAAGPKPYVFNPQLPMRQERGLQAASPSALADRKGICQGPLDCPTRKRRTRRAPLACATATLNKYEAHCYHHAVAPRLLDKRDARSERRTPPNFKTRRRARIARTSATF